MITLSCRRTEFERTHRLAILSVATIGILAAGAIAVAQPVADAATGFAVAAPGGYVASLVAPGPATEVVIQVASRQNGAIGCRVAFGSQSNFSFFTQDQLNTFVDQKPDMFKEGLGAFYEVRSVEGFDHAGVRGAAVLGISKRNAQFPAWKPGIPSLLFVFYTPKGRTSAVCLNANAPIDPRRSEFAAIARGITFAR